MEFQISNTHKPWLSSRVQQLVVDTEINTISAATTLTSQTEDQTVAMSSGASNYVVTLPALSSCQTGQKFQFVLSATAGTNTITITCPDGAKQVGSFWVTGGGSPAVVDETTAHTSIILGSTCVKGDRISLFTDGGSWYWTGFTHAAGALTFA